jgi:transposase-like protein
MMLYPINVMDFEDAFPTDQACFEYLFLVKWPNGYSCPHCQNTQYWKMKDHTRRCKRCRKSTSVLTGTVFQDLRSPMRLVFQAMWYMVCEKQGVSAIGIQQILGLGSYETAWSWLHKFRRAMVRPGRDRLSGTVEVDEIMVGGARSGKRGRGAEGKVLVLCAVEKKEKGVGRIRLTLIPDASAPTLEKAIAEMVDPGSAIRTDGWRGYSQLAKKGYYHTVLSHTEKTPGENPTPLVDKIASLLKRWLLGTHQGRQRPSHIQYYLDEYTFRFNRRKSRSRGLLFLRLVQQALQVEPIIREKLTLTS